MNNISTIQLAYEYLRKNHENQSFEAIWNEISKNIHESNDRKNEIIAELYSDLVLDNRFALTADGKWGLRDFLKFEDVKKQYDYIDNFETTEDFDDMDTILEDDLYGDTDTQEKINKAKRHLKSEDYDEDEYDKKDDDEDDEDDDEDLDGNTLDEDDYD